MPQPLYADAPVRVRADLEVAHTRTWEELALPGTWLTGAERVAVARHSRAARDCQLCAKRKKALSPYGLDGDHDGGSGLPAEVVDAIHRVSTDPGRLSRRILDEVVTKERGEGYFIEVIGVAARTIAIDSFCHAIGTTLHPLPQPEEGQPTRRRPERRDDIGAWAQVLSLDSAEARDLFAGVARPPNVVRALSQVPGETRAQRRLVEAQYLAGREIPTTSAGSRAISRPQLELVAARVAALNQCYY